MKNNFFTHKFLPVLSIFLLALFVLCTSCFAVSSSITINDVSYEVSSFIQTFDKIFIITDGSSYYLFVMPYDSDIVVNGLLYCSSGSFYQATTATRSISELLSFGEDNFTSFSGGSFGYGRDIYYTNFNVYDTDGNLVFQGAPQVEEVPKVELMKATQVEEIPQQIIAVVMIVLPIFLAIFGVLLVLYLIKSKNLLQL